MKRYCNCCNKSTESSGIKKIKSGRNTVHFFICLTCGNPYVYGSFKKLLDTSSGYKGSKRTRGVIKLGKAGSSRNTYELYLQTDHWRKTRLSKLRTQPVCEDCKNEKATQVHHLYYIDEFGKSILYKEKLSDLKSLCNTCHKKRHSI